MLIAFDMDGVLVDVTRSYRDVIRQTARLFFKGSKSWDKLPDPLFSLTDLALIKQSGNLNNDWDVTSLIISLLSNRISLPETCNNKSWECYNETIDCCDVSPLVDFLSSADNPVFRLFQDKGRSLHPVISKLYSGDIQSGNVIQQIFQEIYLGSELFKAVYGIEPRCHSGKGFIHREKPLIGQDILESLSSRHSLAIATGRPQPEALYTLDMFGLRPYFSLILTYDDCVKEQEIILQKTGNAVFLEKPNPYMLDTIVKKSGTGFSDFIYIGDMPDDMAAALRAEAPYRRVGCLMTAVDREGLRKKLIEAGAEWIIEDTKELEKVFFEILSETK